MPFERGRSGNPAGGPVGSRHRQQLNGEFIAALLRDFRHGGPAAIAKVRKNQPAAYCKLLTLLCPRDVKVEHSGGVKAMTDEQLEQTLAILKELIAQRDAAANAKVIQGVAEPVPALPPPSRKARRKVRRSDRALLNAEPTDEVRQPPRGQVSPSKSP
jgi:hypothetical protein